MIFYLEPEYKHKILVFYVSGKIRKKIFQLGFFCTIISLLSSVIALVVNSIEVSHLMKIIAFTLTNWFAACILIPFWNRFFIIPLCSSTLPSIKRFFAIFFESFAYIALVLNCIYLIFIPWNINLLSNI